MKPQYFDKELLYVKAPTFFVDGLWFLGSLFFAMQFPWNEGDIVGLDTTFDFQGVGCLLCLSWFVTAWFWGIKTGDRNIYPTYVMVRAFALSLTCVLLFSLLISMVYKSSPRQVLYQMGLYSWFGITIIHMIVNITAKWVRKRGGNQLRVVFVGNDQNCRTLMNEMRMGFGTQYYIIDGVFNSRYQDCSVDGVPHLGFVADVFPYLGDNNDRSIDEIYCGLSPVDDLQQSIIRDLVNYCNAHFIHFYFVPNMDGYPKRVMDITKKGTISVMSLHEEPLANPLNKVIKRSFDILFSGLFLLFVYPWVFIFVAIGIKRSSPGPIYFKQSRTGYNGHSFTMYKFRSMHVNAQSDTLQATKDDPRKFAFGNFLRRSSIDELPQFINVFKGDMSLIGPRPHMDYHTHKFSELINDYMVRHLVKPGLSGWAQVNGCRGETSTVQQMKDRIEHDIWYIENWTPWLDIEIIWRTIVQVIKGDEQAY